MAEKYLSSGLRHKDSLHLACAIKHNCDYFITTDKKFTNKNHLVEGIEIVNPMQFILKEDLYA
jgi:predicted nucleic acid-binding protein